MSESLLNRPGLFPEEAQIPEAYRLPFPLHQREYLLHGELLSWAGECKEVYSPVQLKTADGPKPVLLGSFPRFGEAQVLKALEASLQAYDQGRGEWPTASVEQRIRCTQKFLALMKAERAEVVNLLMWEIGKNLSDSEKEFDRTVEYIEDTIEELKNLDRVSSRLAIQEGVIGQIRRAPLGVVLSMGPFNYPLNETFTTLIPALIMGNTIIFKPPKFGALLFRPLLKAFAEAFPPGVVNSIYGDGSTVIKPLMESGFINVLAFIGTSRVADLIKSQHPKLHRMKSVLGLEAKNPAVILKDADLELTVKECLLGSLSFNGQRCTALKILFVQEEIAQEFLARFSRAVNELKLGLPWDNAGITPLPEPGKPQVLGGMVKDALDKGAKIVNPGGGETAGSYFAPAVLYPVDSSMRIYHEEQFGPVIPVVPFKKLEEPVEYIISSNYGQQASIFGRDPQTIAELIDPLVNQVCRVNLNSQCQRGPDVFPFTARKDSAEGTLSVSDALRVFSIRTLLAAKENDLNREILREILRERRSNFLNTDFIL